MTEDPAITAYENRTPREKFRKALIRICRRLDGQAGFEIEDNDELTRELVSSGHMKREDGTGWTSAACSGLVGVRGFTLFLQSRSGFA